VNAVDTSIVVAAFGSWHDNHESALEIIRARPRLPSHVALEAYSVLTRLPMPHRATPVLAREFLATTFSGALIQLEAEAMLRLLDELPGLGIVGGATYDALIGETARAADMTLCTCDRRARETYERLGVRVRYLA